MSEQIFKCDPDGFVLLSGDKFRMSDSDWWRLDRVGLRHVGSRAHYGGNPKKPLRLYGERGDDGKIIPIGRFVDDTLTPYYRPLTDAERKELGIEVVQAEKSPTDKHPAPYKWKRDPALLVALMASLISSRSETESIGDPARRAVLLLDAAMKADAEIPTPTDDVIK